jgi:hypothetical protein
MCRAIPMRLLVDARMRYEGHARPLPHDARNRLLANPPIKA